MFRHKENSAVFVTLFFRYECVRAIWGYETATTARIPKGRFILYAREIRFRSDIGLRPGPVHARYSDRPFMEAHQTIGYRGMFNHRSLSQCRGRMLCPSGKRACFGGQRS